MSDIMGVATEANELSRDLLYFAERLSLDPAAANQIYGTGILPRLRQAEAKFARYCGFVERKPAKSEAREITLPTEEAKEN
jgi:hypothetical protein